MHHAVSLVLASLFLLTVTRVASAGFLAKQCRRYCGVAINACVVEGFRRATCKRVVLRECKRRGVSMCLPPPTTTTTVAPAPPPTTTTLPPLPPAPTVLYVAGTWDVFAPLDIGYCPVLLPLTFTTTLHITQSGIFLSGFFGVVSATGQVTGPDSFVFDSDAICLDVCCGAASVTITGVRGVPGALSGIPSVDFAAVCLGGVTCVAHWGP